jgi:hypothetical protein
MYDIDYSATVDPNEDDENDNGLDEVDVVSGAENDTDFLDAVKDPVISGVDGDVGDLSQTEGEPDPEVDYSQSPQELAINSLLKKSVEVKEIKEKPPFANVLHRYASFNYIWTLWVLRKYDLNFPDETYRRGVTGDILLKSGSGDPDNRVELTNYISAADPSGKFEFFIDNVKIGGITGLDKNTGNTNANSISFKILEPYSIGLFFQALQVSVVKSGYGAWNGVPLMLRLEFTGHLDQYRQKVKVPKATKYFPLKIMNMSMKVDGGGCYYDCTAIPWNEQAYNTVISNAKKNVNIEGSNVQEMLQKGPQSLQWQLNDAEKDVAKDGTNPHMDKVLILFPADIKTRSDDGAPEDNSQPTGATTDPSKTNDMGGQDIYNKLDVQMAADGINLVQNDNVNPMGLSTMGFGDLQRAKQKFGVEEDVYDEKAGVFKRGNIKIEKTKGMAEFAKGSSIPTMINEIILTSQYGRQALDNITGDGWVPWWKVETQLYILEGDETVKKTGRYPTLAVYRVVPTYIHSSRFLAPTDKPAGIEQLKRKAIKEYNYIYTSKNLDILEFNIEFNNSFYKQLSADLGKNNVGVVSKSQTGSEAVPDEAENSGTEVSPESSSELLPVDSVRVSNSGLKTATEGVVGGTADNDAGTLAARSFNDAINSGVDMIELNLKILGDPFYLGDSGMGNYTAQNTNLKGINADGAINYQSSEVFIKVNFRNPVDIDQTTGRYEFGNGKVVPQFSGLYRVGEVYNNFNKGMFTQDLKLMKMPNQDTEKQSSNTKPTVLATQIADEPPPAPTDEAGNEYDEVEGGP